MEVWIKKAGEVLTQPKRRNSLVRASFARTYLNLSNAVLLFIISIGIGIYWYMAQESYSFGDAFFMTIITITTVGYGEIQPLSEAGKWFTSFYILANVGIFAYALSAFTYFIIQGEIFKKLYIRAVEKEIKSLRNHVIVCGYGRYGKEVADHFIQQQIPFIIIENGEKAIEEIQKHDPPILFVEDDATHEDALEKANILHARALVSALPDDADNIFTVITARTMNPSLNIISRALDQRSVRKMKLAGASHVIMPEQIGGFYMATLVSKPGAVEFFTFITNEAASDIGFEEISYKDLPKSYMNRTIAEMNVRKETGINIIGFRNAAGKYSINPSPDTQITENTSFIVLGNQEQLNSLKEYFNRIQS